MPPVPSNALPIEAVLSQLLETLRTATNAVLVAPPGAGKTTRVPLALLDEPWARGKKIILLEPRRLAARAAAERMASMLGEAVGQTVGIRVRLGSNVSRHTRIEVVTDGVFSRMILDDPELTDVAGVVFDEFHERSLDADIGLAFALDAQEGLREDLRILVMSATLDGAQVARLMKDAPVVTSSGRAFPVETRYVGHDPRQRIENQTAHAILKALEAETGSILVFLPGAAEIRRVEALLQDSIRDSAVSIVPLHGTMDQAAQSKAVMPASAGQRKVVLATSLAETSLTIDGVRVVIDAGFSRVPRFEPGLGLTRLETVRVSRAGADQRRGRAGRTEPGVCYRLWTQAGSGALVAFAEPEILNSDLSGLLLDCAAWGIGDPTKLRFLTLPPPAALNEARCHLEELGALDTEGRITQLGRAMRALPLPPTLARMLLCAVSSGSEALAAEIAALLVERGLGGASTHLLHRLEDFRSDRSSRASQVRSLAQAWARSARTLMKDEKDPQTLSLTPGALLALAFPNRIAKARGKPGDFLMANGRAGLVDAADPLAKEPYLAIADVTGKAGAAHIRLACPLTLDEIEQQQASHILTHVEVAFDPSAQSLQARKRRQLGQLLLADHPCPVSPSADMSEQAMAVLLGRGIGALGLQSLPWTISQSQWRARVLFLRNSEPGIPWPDVSDETLTSTIEVWLAPALVGLKALSEVSAPTLDRALSAFLTWDLSQRLDKNAPTHFEAPTGSRLLIDYGAAGGPAVHVRVQELFGVKAHPALAGGGVPLALHLLSPARQPLQITTDLPGFWSGSWREVRAQMRGRYPKHPWPEHPADAPPTARAKPRPRS